MHKMNHKPKNILSAVLLVTCITSCQEKVLDTDPMAISFSTVQTKAVDSNGMSEFSVIGAYGSDVGFRSDNLPCFTNVPVSYNGSSWTYTNTQYWHGNNHYRFRAVHPASCGTPENYSDDLHSNAYVKFTVNNNPANQTDLLITDLKKVDVGALTSTPQGAVALNFKHMLCKINVNVKTVADPTDRFTITSMSLIGAGSEWTLMLISNNDGETWSPTWIRKAGAPSLSFASNVTGPVTSTTGVPCFGANGLLLVPEDNDNIKLRVAYSVEHKTNVDPETWGAPANKTVDFTLPHTPVWEAGKEITYTLTMAESYNITFGSPTVQEWGEIKNTGTVIIK